MRITMLLVCTLAVGCGGSVADSAPKSDASAEGATDGCGPKQSGEYVCCEGDVVAEETCVDGHWTCPSGYSWIQNSKCMYGSWAPDAASSCGGLAPADCLAGSAGHACSDVAQLRICGPTGWACPAGTIPQTECGCAAGPTSPGMPPRNPGDPCPDAGVPDDASTD
jgi:hypothetical protein